MPDNLQNQLSRTLGDAYTIDRELGGGGMSRVYVAEDTRLRRKVVIKLLSPELAAGVSAERFEREIQLAAALQQANIVPVLSAGETEGLPWYSMPFIDGLSLRARLARNGAMPVAEVVSVLRDVSRALAYAHEHGIVHRDIKPENILLSGDAAVVTDFGIAKALSASRTNAPGGTLTQVGTSIGTPAYMAPEQAAGDPNIDHRADIYALGCVAYEMLSGAPPFSNRPVHQIFAAHMTEAPAPVASKRTDVPKQLASLIMRCLEKDANKRPQSAREVLQSLDSVTSGSHASNHARRRAVPVAIAAVAVIAAVGFFGWRAKFGGAATNEERSIAVLPFAAGGDSAQSYFAEGIADELTTALARIPGLRVASRSAAFSTAKSAPSAQAAGKTLHVTTVLEGSVRRAGQRIRITAQLTNVADGLSLWSDTFEQDGADVFTAQDELSRRITGALHQKLAMASTGTVSTDRGTRDQDAYDLYLRGRYLFQHRGEPGLRRAAALFSEAFKRDPAFARALAGLALVQVVLPEYTQTPDDTLYTAGLRNAEHAIALDQNLSDGHLALGYGLIARWQLDSSEAAFRRALALAPNDPAVHQWYGDMLQARGRLPEARAQMDAAISLDPMSALLQNEIGFNELNMQQYDKAIAAFHKGIELDSTLTYTYGNIALAYTLLGQVDSALALLKKQQALQGGLPTGTQRANLAMTFAVAGRTTEARAEIAKLEQEVAKGRVANFQVASAYASLRDRANTLKWITQSVDAHESEPLVLTIVCTPQFLFLASDAEFKAQLKRLNLGTCQR